MTHEEQTFREPEWQVARWLEELKASQFEVEHRAWARHSNADALSCRPCATNGCCYCEWRETHEQELREEEEEEDCAAVGQVEVFLCQKLQAVDVAEWGQQQEQDTDLQPLLL